MKRPLPFNRFFRVLPVASALAIACVGAVFWYFVHHYNASLQA